ncbi:acyltransferase [Acidocella sp.]|uniref:acyltransferase family protein n=1 Tax=Acidocella sp. TaxID=50710 RepID=UPI002610BCEB|nr:acyltransferase [Acidocella sp.]
MPAQAAKLKLNTLELGRFIAATVVVLTHIIPDLNPLAAPGAAPLFGGHGAPGELGVCYFFVLSGFVMAYTHKEDFGHVGGALRFWWRRACRIYPIYWLALLIPLHYLYSVITTPKVLGLYLLSSFAGTPPTAFTLSRLLDLVLLSPFANTPWGTTELIPPAWTLRYELAFYLMLGMAMLPYIGKPLLAAWVALVFWHWLPVNILAFFNVPPPFLLNDGFVALQGRADRFGTPLEFFFFAGLAAGWVFAKHPPGRLWGSLLALAGAAGMADLLPSIDYGTTQALPMPTLLEGVLLAMLIVGLGGLERAGVIRLGKWATVAGMISYPLYILHFPVLTMFDVHKATLHWALSTGALYALGAAALLGIYGLAALATYFFDQPVQRGLRRLSRLVAGRVAGHRRGQTANAGLESSAP